MDNGAYKSELDYTTLADEYEGYTIEWATSRSQSEPGKWMGHYRARKDGAKTLAASIANLQSNPADAQNTAIRIAKATIDEGDKGNG
jgi:hypothetical protein